MSSRQTPQDVDGAVETAVPHVRLATFIIYISHFLRHHEGAERESYANPFSFIGSMYQIDKQNHPDYAIDEEALGEDQILADYRMMRVTESQWVQLRPQHLRGSRVLEADKRKQTAESDSLCFNDVYTIGLPLQAHRRKLLTEELIPTGVYLVHRD
ncbi:hypothetical protein C8034_v011482 [Colletotrichum sidae]|uniref:Uncharacterized protein n=1 Tax=Colletotrichum sidae TaxID=1347389 RepID=A0A4R8TJ33_9PEZI|nr:hypothetical protein C8034_v011482 [Colletotrichum sidae]